MSVVCLLIHATLPAWQWSYTGRAIDRCITVMRTSKHRPGASGTINRRSPSGGVDCNEPTSSGTSFKRTNARSLLEVSQHLVNIGSTRQFGLPFVLFNQHWRDSQTAPISITRFQVAIISMRCVLHRFRAPGKMHQHTATANMAAPRANSNKENICDSVQGPSSKPGRVLATLSFCSASSF